MTEENKVKCPKCEGKGTVTAAHGMAINTTKCLACEGEGEVVSNDT